MEQIVDFPVSGGGLQDYCPGQSSSSSSHFPTGVHEVLDEPGAVFFSHFSRGQKKCGFRSRPESERARQWQLMNSVGL